jgi:hypothetical protein
MRQGGGNNSGGGQGGGPGGGGGGGRFGGGRRRSRNKNRNSQGGPGGGGGNGASQPQGQRGGGRPQGGGQNQPRDGRQQRDHRDSRPNREQRENRPPRENREVKLPAVKSRELPPRKFGVVFYEHFATAKADIEQLKAQAAQFDQLNIVINEEGNMDDPILSAVGKIFAGAAWTLIHKRRVEDGWYEKMQPAGPVINPQPTIAPPVQVQEQKA